MNFVEGERENRSITRTTRIREAVVNKSSNED